MAVVMPFACLLGDHGVITHLEDAVEACEVGRIVRRHQHREVLSLTEEKSIDNFPAGLIEGRVGFIEQKNFRALHDCAGNQAALQLSARERVHRSVGEVGESHAFEGEVDGVVAMETFFQPTVVGVSAHLDESAQLQRKIGRQVRALGEVGDMPPSGPRGRVTDEHRPAFRRRQSSEDAEQGGLTRAVRADERRPAPAGNFEARVAERRRSIGPSPCRESSGENGDSSAARLLWRCIREGWKQCEHRSAEATRP